MGARTVKGLLVRALLFTALIAAVGLALLLYARSWAPSREKFPMQGVVLGQEQGEVEWAVLPHRNVDFAYLYATSGANLRDRNFTRNWAAARSVGIRYGAIHHYALCRSPRDQATLFIATVPRDNAALPPVVQLDLKDGCNTRPDRKAALADISRFIEMIESHSGKPALIRVSKDFDALYNVGEGINRTLWLNGNVFTPDYAGRPWVMWTASDFRRLDGVENAVEWSVVRP